MKYLISREFAETIGLLALAIGIILGSRSIEARFIKTKSNNQSWYRSVKIVIEIVNVVLITIIILLALDVNGVNVSKMIRSLGVIGIVVGFALNDLLKDFIMGLSIMFENYFKVGDVVIYQGRVGKVVSFNIKTTKLFIIETEETLSISNRNITEISVASDWIDVDIPIGYDLDPIKSRDLCRECARRIERLRYVYVCDFLNTQDFLDSWITYKLRVHCLQEKRYLVRRNANAVVQDVFYEHGVAFPLSIKVIVDNDQKKTISKVSPENIKTIKSTKKSYELGRGAAQSKLCPVDETEKTFEKAIKEAERYAGSENLDKKMLLRIRLLSEELLLISRDMPNLRDGKFQVLRDGENYILELTAMADISAKDAKKIAEAASSRGSVGYAGVSGKLRYAIDSMISLSMNNGEGEETMDGTIGKSDEDYRWSYKVYQENAEDTLSVNEEDIGKSVISSLADDVKIFVRKNHVNIKILVKNMEE